MQISRMFPEQLSWRHAVNIPLLPADVEQHWCPRVTLNGPFRWSLLCYTTDILQTLFPRMCESCRGGVGFIGKAGSKQCIPEENTACSSWLCCTEQGAGASPASPCQTCVHLWLWVSCCLSLQGGWPAFVNPSGGKCTHSDSSKSSILWNRRNLGLAHLFPFINFSRGGGKVFACCLEA